MKFLGVREFRDRASQHLAAGEVLGIQSHGRLIGVYVPVKSPDPQKVADLARRLAAQVEQVSAETGLSEAELVELFESEKIQPDTRTDAPSR
jgi:antitoxin (DNA-binding transcriptional repressor) of toxin-antitoxin stability system